MRTLLVFEVEVDEGTRPSTRVRRIDSVRPLSTPDLSREVLTQELPPQGDAPSVLPGVTGDSQADPQRDIVMSRPVSGI